MHSFLAPVEEETDNITTFDMIKDATTIDDQTAEFDLGDDPYGPFTTVTLATSVVNKFREEDKDGYNEIPVGLEQSGSSATSVVVKTGSSAELNILRTYPFY